MSKSYYRQHRDDLLAQKKEYYARNREKILEYKREAYASDSQAAYKVWLKRLKTFGLTEQAYIEIFNAQGGCCAICRAPEISILRGKVKRLGVDHDYETGLHRGLLCSRCNTLIGLALEDEDILEAAKEYLRLWKKKPNL